MVKIYFRHEKPRPFQRQFMADIYAAVAQRHNFMAHAPTGSGKTDSAISAALSFALENKKDIFFLTPKISQHKIAIETVCGLGEKHGLAVRAVDLIGRRLACIHPEISKLEGESFYHVCALRRKKAGCAFHNNISGRGLGGKEGAEKEFAGVLGAYGCGRTHAEMIEMGREKEFCPYELMMKTGAVSNVIVGDYYHFIVPAIREPVLNKTGKRIENCIVIIDEAHNLAARVRDYLSSATGTFTLRRVEKELRISGFKPPPLASRFEEWAGNIMGGKEECTTGKEEFYDFLSQFGQDFSTELEEAGLAFIMSANKRSACLKFAEFVEKWDDGFDSVRILKKGRFGLVLSKKMLDPSALTSVLNETHASILMSGTLLPLEMHRDVLGLDKNRTAMKSYPSPFSADSIRNMICSGVTTKFTERNSENYLAFAGKINKTISATPGGTAVFFPSYNVMDSILPRIDADGREIFEQEPEMRPRETRQLLDDFTKKGGILCGVQGGSLAEGIDYCKGELKTIIIVGIALDEMNLETEALIDYYNKKFGKGWEYGYLYPGTIKALQAAGRGRRKESDRVAVVYMDERFRWKKYNWIFDRKEKVLVTSQPEKYVKEFWNEDKANK